MQRAARLGIKVSDEHAERGAHGRGQAQQRQVQRPARGTRAAGHRLPRLPRGNAPGDDAAGAAPARRLSRIYVSPREIDQCIAKRKGSPGRTAGIQPRAHPGRVPARRRPSSRSRSGRRGRRASTSAPGAARTSPSSRSRSPIGATALEGGKLGWRKASQLPSFVAELVPAHEAGRGHRARSARRAACTSSSCVEVRGAEQAALVEQVHARHILMQTNGRRGRRDRAPEALPDPRARAEGRGLRRHRLGHLGRQGLRRAAAATSAGRARASFVPEFDESSSRRCRSTRSASRSRRSSAGTSCSCSAAALRRVDRRDAQQVRVAAARSAGRGRNGDLGAPAARRSLRRIPVSDAEPRSRPSPLTTGEPAGIGPDLCAALPGRRLNCRVVLLGGPLAARAVRGERRRMNALPDYDPCRPRQATASRCCTCRSARTVPRRAPGSRECPIRARRCSTGRSTVASRASSTRW